MHSQDKECLTNISNIQYVYKNHIHGLGTYYDHLKILGTYETKERAIEILDEIQTKINNIANVDDENFINIVYQMPEK